MKRFAAILLAALPAASETRAESDFNFMCADGSTFLLEFENADTAVLTIGRVSFTLRNRHPSWGLWFTSQAADVREHHGTAVLRLEGRSPITCRRIG